MKTIIYTRNGNVNRQVSECSSYIFENNLQHIGTTADKNEVISSIVSGEVDVLLVYNKSRISRERREYERIEHLLSRYGVIIKSVTE